MDTPVTPPPPPLDSTETGKRLIEFYKIHNPEKLEDTISLTEILHRYKGRETKLFADLHRKYKVKNDNLSPTPQQKMKPKISMHDILGSRFSTGFNNWIDAETPTGTPTTPTTPTDKENMFGNEKEAKRQRQRIKCIKELLSTEKTYVDLMSKLVEHYTEKLRGNANGLSSNDYQILFPSDIHAILGLNQTFLNDLSKVIESKTFNNETSKIGDILVTFCPHFKMYQTYCNNYNLAAKRLATLRKKTSSQFCKYCNQQATQPYFNDLSLEQLLILPIQRMPRYKLLVQEIIKYTELCHPDREQLNIAFKEISKVNTSINDRIKIFESQLEVQSIENRFGGKVNNLVTPARIVIHRGQLCKIETKGGGEHINYLFILFNDCILYALEGSANKLTLGNILYFDSNFSVQKTSGSIKLISNLKYLFELHSTNESFFLYTKTKQNMEHWLDIITDTYDNYMESGTVKQEENLYSATLFIPWEFAVQCMITSGCSKKFTMTNRRYSCKYCGYVVCGGCSTKKLKIKNYKMEKRVCDVCYKNNRNNQLDIKVISQRISTRSIGKIQITGDAIIKQQRYEVLLVKGYLRQFCKPSKKQKLLGIQPKLPQRVVYLCNLLYGSIKAKKRVSL